MTVTVEQLKALPLWKPGERILDSEKLAFSSQNSVRGSDGQAHDVSRKEYEWAIDPAGNVVPVTVRSNRLNPYSAVDVGHGADRGPFKQQRIGMKQSAGFLFLRLPALGYETNKEGWLAHCATKANERLAAHAAKSHADAKAFRTFEERMVSMTVEGQKAAIGELVKQLAASQKGGKRGSADADG